MPRILVTPRSMTSAPPPELLPLTEAGFELVCSPAGRLPEPDELAALLPGCVGWLAGVEKVPERVIEAARELRVISRNGSGVDNLPLAACEARGIAVLRADGANSVGVAELSLALILTLLRRITETDRGIKAGGWPRLLGAEVSGRTVGILGVGAIGAHVARVAAAMGARVLGCDPMPRDPGIHPALFRFVPLREMLAEADIVSLHAPGRADGLPILGAAQLAQMRPGAVIVNTARASLVDEAALFDGLESGRIAGYGTDVFAEEPPRELHFVSHRRVVATSHVGALTAESVRRATAMAVQNLLSVLRRREAA